MSLFSAKQLKAVAVDIGTSSVKVLELNRKGSRYRVGQFAIEALPRNAVVERGISDVEAVGAAVRQAVKRAKCKRKPAIVAISSSHVVSRTVQLPVGLRESEIEEQVMIEASQHIPHPLEEVNLDYQILEAPEADGAHVVKITACRKEIIEGYTMVIESAGLQAAVVDVDSFAVERGFSFVTAGMSDALKGKVIALIDFGEVTTRLDIFVDGAAIYDRDHSFGGRILTENIRTRYGISSEEAEAAKLSGDLPENYRDDLLEPFKATMAREVSRAVEFFVSAGRGYEAVDMLFITGGCTRIEGIADVVQLHTGLPTAVASPFSSSGIQASAILQQQSPLLLKACGLAVRGAG